MECPACQYGNRADAKFCSECGYKFELTCPKCRSRIKAGSKYCDECGHAIINSQKSSSTNTPQPASYTPKYLTDNVFSSRSAIEGERKLVTVMFADIANYTAIGERLDSEQVHQIMDRFFKLLVDLIHRYEGTVNQFTGDGIMAIFGAPVSHENHAQQACYAALAVQKAMLDFGIRLKEEKDIDLRLRIGINTGPVVVGGIGDDARMDYTALGDTTNLAARMQQSAKPGCILVADSTFKVINTHFKTEPLGNLHVKGREKPVSTYLLKRARSMRTLMDSVAEKGLSPLIGRSEELDRLHRLWELSKKGQGQIVFIVGEAGIGKSRLVFEFHRALSTEKITWLEGRCQSHGRNMPFSPLVELLKRNFRIDEEDSDEIMSQKINTGLSALGDDAKQREAYIKYLFSVAPNDTLIQSMDAQGRRRMIFDTIRLMTILGSRLRPLVIFFEDLHWIDHETEDFLKYVINSLAALPVMMILTYRPEYVNPFGELTFFNRLSLKALQESESLELTGKVIGGGRLPVDVKPLILERAGGNPFYIEEIVKSLEDAGSFNNSDAIDKAGFQNLVQIPTSIQDIIMARIDRLPEEQKTTLQNAAVIGREFTYRLVEGITRITADLHDVLGELEKLEIMYQTHFYPESAYMFKHALTHDVAYNSLLTSKRKAIHARTGKVIERMYATRLREQYEILAHHFAEGEVLDKAIAYLILSAEKAVENMANPSAYAFYTKAIEIKAQKNVMLSPEQVYDIYQGKGVAEFNMGRYDDAEKDFFKARTIAREIGDQNKEAESLSMAGWSMASEKKFEAAMATYRKAIEFGRNIGNPTVEGRNLVGLGLMNFALGQVQSSEKYIEKAVDIGKKINSPLLLILSLSLRAFQFPHYGTPNEEALAYLQESIPKLKSVHNARACVLVYLILGYNLACKGNYTASTAFFQEGITFAEETGEALNRAKGLNWLGWVYGDLGWISEAKKLNQESYLAALEMESGSEEVEANAVVNLAENAVAEKDFDLAERYIRDLLNKAESNPGYKFARHRWGVRQLCTSAQILAYRNDTGQAMKSCQRAYEIAEKTNNIRGMIRANIHMGEICTKTGEFSKGEKKLNAAMADARKINHPVNLWKTHFALGHLKSKQGNEQKARGHYEEGLRVIMDVGSSLEDEKLREALLHSEPVEAAKRLLEDLK